MRAVALTVMFIAMFLPVSGSAIDAFGTGKWWPLGISFLQAMFTIPFALVELLSGGNRSGYRASELVVLGGLCASGYGLLLKGTRTVVWKNSPVIVSILLDLMLLGPLLAIAINPFLAKGDRVGIGYYLFAIANILALFSSNNLDRYQMLFKRRTARGFSV